MREADRGLSRRAWMTSMLGGMAGLAIAPDVLEALERLAPRIPMTRGFDTYATLTQWKEVTFRLEYPVALDLGLSGAPFPYDVGDDLALRSTMNGDEIRRIFQSDPSVVEGVRVLEEALPERCSPFDNRIAPGGAHAGVRFATIGNGRMDSYRGSEVPVRHLDGGMRVALQWDHLSTDRVGPLMTIDALGPGPDRILVP